MAEDAHLQIGRSAEIVDEQRYGAGRGRGAGEPLGHHFRDLPGERKLDPLDARFAVNAEPEFRLPRVQPSVRLLTGNRAYRRRNAEALHRIGGAAASAATRSSAAPGFRRAARDLVHEEGSGDAARPGEIVERDVVGDDDHLDFQTVRARPFRRKAEIQTIAGVVLDDQQTAAPPGYRDNRRIDRMNGRRREYVAADCGRQRAASDETGVRGLVSRAAAGDDRHFRAVPVGANDDLDVWKSVKARQRAGPRRRQESLDRLGDDRVAPIDEVAHGKILSIRESRQASWE